MKHFLLSAILLAGCAAQSPFEKEAIERARTSPETAESYFLQRIEEDKPPIEEQAVYLYAMGVASERMGDDMEALNNYLGAEALGYKNAPAAIARLKNKELNQ